MSYHIPYVWNLKRNYRNELTKQKETHREPIYCWRGEGIVRKFGKDMDTLLYLRWITNKDLMYNTRISTQFYVPVQMAGEVWGRTDTSMCMAESLHCSPNLPQHC